MIHDDWALEPGDLVLAQLGPVSGSVQDGLRPVLVVSAAGMHQLSRRAMICPVTRNTRPWPTKVLLPEGSAAEGAILCDQLRAIDRRTRIVRRLGTANPETLRTVRSKIAALLGIDAD